MNVNAILNIESSNVYELVFTTFNRSESAHVLNELARNKANAKKVMKIGQEYGDINEALTTIEFKEFYTIFESLEPRFSMHPQLLKKAYKELVATSEYFN
tara:strand:+ start:253 stop:552 length:300 start_codon:yes stop_codon:yes gene_type:complete